MGKEKARLCVDWADKDNTREAIKMLRQAGFRVSVTPVSGLGQPELWLGSNPYFGLEEIREMIIEKRKESFKDYLEKIESKKIRDFVKKSLSQAPKEFYTAPASSTGEHHALEEQGEGGLVVHTLKGLRVVSSLFDFFVIENQLAKDKIIAGYLLHDIKKGGDPWINHTDPEHGFIAASWLIKIAAIEPEPEKEDFVHVDRDLMDIIELVREHMGIFNSPLRTPALIITQPVTEKSIWHLIVQIADYWASRKWCSFTY